MLLGDLRFPKSIKECEAPMQKKLSMTETSTPRKNQSLYDILIAFASKDYTLLNVTALVLFITRLLGL